jgi:PPP family 3-phenylpropionic acid transporter
VALAPVVPLADAQALRAVGGEGGRYARVRLFGSIGFVSTAVGLGWLLEGGLPVAHVPSIAAWAVLVAFLGTLGFPPAPLGGPPLRIREAAELWGDLRVRHLLIACLIHWAAMSPYHSLFALHVGGLGLSSGVTGLAMAVGAAAEVLVMASALRWIGRGSTRGWLIGAFLVSAARWALTAVVRDPWILAAIQAFHAFSFGVFYLSAVQALVRWVPDRLRATGQGLFGAAVFGVGGWIGTAAGGLIFDRLGGRALFGLSACAACLAAAWAARIAATEEG